MLNILNKSFDEVFTTNLVNRTTKDAILNLINLTKMAESYEQFLLFPQCFQKACFPGASKGVIVWEWVKLDVYSFLNETRTGFGFVRTSVEAKTETETSFILTNTPLIID